MSGQAEDGPRLLPTGVPPTGQVAFVVTDLDVAVERWRHLGFGPWNVWTFDERRLPKMLYRGEQGSFAMRLALCSIGPVTYELIQSLRGPNIYDDFLEERGPGVHHLGYYVDEIDGAIAAMEAKGYPMVQAGWGFGVDGDGAFAYFDTVDDYGCYYEAILGPRALPDPEEHVPL
ncbi:MAG: methylmalonyl-CoA/ethylmalonyl-CoA epimerase [Actinomycetota bacterium]|nr:methylmalonyl-CoA/ethylmalonyl-CoA epimerase [Actinomycetota bacterium]